MNKEKQVQTWKNVVIVILVCVTLIAIGISVWAIKFREKKVAVAPDYAVHETEEYAKLIEDDHYDEKMTSEKGGGAVSMTYQKTVNVDLKSRELQLLFQNPSKSVNNIVIQIVVVPENGDDIVIAESGILLPGYGIDKLQLAEDESELSEGVYNGKFVVSYYNPDTGEKSILNSNIEGIEITVHE